MSTLDDLIESISSSLHAYTGTHEVSTWLTASATASDTTLTVDDPAGAVRGLAEIGDELVYVHSTSGNTITLPPYGRGYRQTTAAAHDVDTQVIFDPVFPRAEIRKGIDQCVESLFPKLYQIKTTTFVYDASQVSFDLPADCEGVLAVKEESPNDLNHWNPLSRWQFDAESPLTNGKALAIHDFVRPSSNIQVVYRANFDAFTTGSDTLASVGLSESYADLILYCVSSRMIRFLDTGRLQIGAVENVSRAAVVAAGDAGKLANQLYGMYAQRLEEERRRLLELDPPTIKFSY